MTDHERALLRLECLRASNVSEPDGSLQTSDDVLARAKAYVGFVLDVPPVAEPGATEASWHRKTLDAWQTELSPQALEAERIRIHGYVRELLEGIVFSKIGAA